MKNVWTEMSQQIEKQKKLTDKLIIDMTREKYKSMLSKIRTPEIIGSFICYSFAVLILFNFNKYETGYLILCSIISAAIFILLPILSLRSINKINEIDIAGSNLKKILADYVKEKKRFLSVQKLSFYLGFVLLVTMLPVMLKIMGGKTTEVKTEVWFWFLPLASLFFFLFARWVFRYYMKTTIQVEKLLNELND